MNGFDHEVYRELLERHLDMDLDEHEVDELMLHLEECEECARIWKAEERLRARLSEVPRLVMPSTLRQDILNKALSQRNEGNDVNDSSDDMPVFSGVPARRRPTRIAILWRASRPALAAAFVVCAGTAALYVGAFNQVPGAKGAQTLLVNAVQNLGGSPVPDRAPIEIAQSATPAPQPPSRPVEAVVLPEKKDQLPPPAETQGALVSALVIRRTDTGERNGFEPDMLAGMFEKYAEQRGGETIQRSDQYVTDGSRFTTLVVRLPDATAENLIRSLDNHRHATDAAIIDPLISTGALDANLKPGVVYCTGAESDLRNCLASATETALVASNSDGMREVRVILVD